MLTQPATRMLATLLLALALPAGTRAEEPNPQVKVITNLGEFVIEVRQDRAPLTAANFLRYAREGFYSGTLIHRVVANFVIQGGGHDATTYALKTPHENVANESGDGLQNKRGTVGLARGEAPHSGNAQFYVNLVDNPDLDPVPTRWGYAAFGRILQGMDVLYILGDLFEAWVGDDDQDPEKERVCLGLRALTQRGVACFALHGNHDFLLGKGFGERSGCRLLGDPVIAELDGEPVLLTHGDTL